MVMLAALRRPAPAVCSTIILRCVDCTAPIVAAYDYTARALVDPIDTARRIAAHAREMPLLHPTLLPDHHSLRRPA